MIKLFLNKINDYSYVFKDINDKEYILNIQFYDIAKPSVGDVFYFSNKIINEKNVFSFGPLNDSDPNLTIDDIIKANINGKDIYLQRYYG